MTSVTFSEREVEYLEEQRLAEALGGDDQHLLGGRGVEEVGDLVVEMQELAAELVEVLRLDVLRIDHPGFHVIPLNLRWPRRSTSPRCAPNTYGNDIRTADTIPARL